MNRQRDGGIELTMEGATDVKPEKLPLPGGSRAYQVLFAALSLFTLVLILAFGLAVHPENEAAQRGLRRAPPPTLRLRHRPGGPRRGRRGGDQNPDPDDPRVPDRAQPRARVDGGDDRPLLRRRGRRRDDRHVRRGELRTTTSPVRRAGRGERGRSGPRRIDREASSYTFWLYRPWLSAINPNENRPAGQRPVPDEMTRALERRRTLPDDRRHPERAPAAPARRGSSR